MGLFQAMAGLRPRRALFAVAAAVAEGGPVAWLVSVETTDGAIVERIYRCESAAAALAMAGACDDVHGLRWYRPVTLSELQAIEEEAAATAAGKGATSC